MNKSHIVDAIASAIDCSKTSAATALETVLEQIKNALVKGEDVSLVGFGSFIPKKRAARTGRNPKTGDPLQIPEATVPSFKAGKALKDAVNHKEVA